MLSGSRLRHLHVFLLLLCLGSSLHAHPLRIGVSESILSLPFFVAQNEGYFKKWGVDVAIVSCVGGHRCMKNMLAGQTDLATATELPVVFHSFERSDFAILTTFVSTSNDMKVLARTKASVSQPLDLRNRRVGYVKGTASQYMVDLTLVYSGVDPSQVTPVSIDPETALKALAKSEVDALCIWEPYASRIQTELGPDVRLIPVPRLYTETFNLIAMKSAIQTQPRDLELVLLALKDSTDFINDHPGKAKTLLAQRFGIPMATIEKIFHDYRYKLSLNRSLARTMEGQARWAVREKHVDPDLTQPNYNVYLYPELLKKADPSAVSLP
jgi:ABC-type nitrate/sulfonate/bicarbonate transport system substrate-binding protein